MAWPPPVLPINRTNATAQLDIHPADHNTQAQAINDIVTKIQGNDAALATRPLVVHGLVSAPPDHPPDTAFIFPTGLTPAVGQLPVGLHVLQAGGGGASTTQTWEPYFGPTKIVYSATAVSIRVNSTNPGIGFSWMLLYYATGSPFPTSSELEPTGTVDV